MRWLSTGIPDGAKLLGAGTLQIKEPARARPGQVRVIHTKNARSLPYNRSRAGARLNAMLS
jgi:hypothetical protein